MQILIILFYCVFGFSAGLLTAAAYFAIVTMVGVYNRLAKVTHTANKIRWYENVIIAGVSIGNIIFIFDLPVPVGIVGTIIYALFAGIFIGLFSVCLAETIKALPIFVRRIRIGTGIGIVIIAIALGKGLGQLLYYLKLYI